MERGCVGHDRAGQPPLEVILIGLVHRGSADQLRPLGDSVGRPVDAGLVADDVGARDSAGAVVRKTRGGRAHRRRGHAVACVGVAPHPRRRRLLLLKMT